MNAAEQLEADVIVLGVRCELVESTWQLRRYVGRVGQLTVGVVHAFSAPPFFEIELCGAIAPAYVVGATLDAAECAVEAVLRERAKAIVGAARAIGAIEAEREVPCGYVHECGDCDVCRSHQAQEAEYTRAELRGYR